MIFLEDIPLPLMVWSLGVLSGSSLHKQITHCEMKKTWKIAGSWTPGIRVQETFWFPILAQFRRKKGRDTSLKKKMQPTLGRAWLSVHSSVHGESSWLIGISGLWKTSFMTLLLHCLLSAVTVFKTVCHKSKDLGLPKEKPYVGTFYFKKPMTRLLSNQLLEQTHGVPTSRISVAGNHARKAKTQQPKTDLFWSSGTFSTYLRPIQISYKILKWINWTWPI